MLFGIVYSERNPSVDGQKRSLQLFANWQSPVEFKGHWAFATGGGMGLVETESPEALLESFAPWTPFFEFKAEPVVEIEGAVPIYARAQAWRDSVA